MTITLDITGISQAAAFWVSNKGGSNGWKLFTYIYIMLTVLSITLGNDQVICTSSFYIALPISDANLSQYLVRHIFVLIYLN